MKFSVITGWEVPFKKDTVFLRTDNWDDYGFKTTFHATYCNGQGEKYELGTVKIARVDSNVDGYSGRTSDYLDSDFDSLSENYFSLWQTAEAYKRVMECERKYNIHILKALNDISLNPNIYEKYQYEDVMKSSLFRDVSYTLYVRQFRRIVRGEAILTPYEFSYIIKNNNSYVEDCSLVFSVRPDSLPPTNTHAIIGSNGTGKTTIIKNMIKSICNKRNKNGEFRYSDTYDDNGSFENIICISLNPFDDYSDVEHSDIKYIGIKKEYEPIDEGTYEDGYGELSLLGDIRTNFVDSLNNCLADITKRDDLLNVLEMLETECNFISSNYELNLSEEGLGSDVGKSIDEAFNHLSAGHKVVLSIITRCIDVLVEKSIVFIDEPENHLHPPLLSSLIRGISKMLIKRNGVAIISTHSPIVLQEIPRSSVWILNREGNIIKARRPEIETFGTNIGVLTNEIFGYEVKRTGFNTLLQNEVNKNHDYDSVLKAFEYQLGDEAKSIIRIMLKQKEEQ